MLCVQSLCSWSLVELYRAMGSSVEAHKAVLAAHPMYANLMERALAKVVLQHVTTLEKFCQVNSLQRTSYHTAQACCISQSSGSSLACVGSSLCILLPCCGWTVHALHGISVITCRQGYMTVVLTTPFQPMSNSVLMPHRHSQGCPLVPSSCRVLMVHATAWQQHAYRHDWPICHAGRAAKLSVKQNHSAAASPEEPPDCCTTGAGAA